MRQLLPLMAATGCLETKLFLGEATGSGALGAVPPDFTLSLAVALVLALFTATAFAAG